MNITASWLSLLDIWTITRFLSRKSKCFHASLPYSGKEIETGAICSWPLFQSVITSHSEWKLFFFSPPTIYRKANSMPSTSKPLSQHVLLGTHHLREYLKLFSDLSDLQHTLRCSADCEAVGLRIGISISHTQMLPWMKGGHLEVSLWLKRSHSLTGRMY